MNPKRSRLVRNTVGHSPIGLDRRIIDGGRVASSQRAAESADRYISGSGQRPSQQVRGARLEPLITRTMEEGNLTGFAIGVVEDDRLVYSRGFGVMKLGDSTHPVTPETLFHMASITKPFVATAVMQLVEQRKVDLDAPVARYVPYFRLKDPRYKDITVRQMLTHTSGMPDVKDYCWDKPEYDEGALERYVRSLEDKRLLWPPGQRFRYSNMAFEVLGDLVAKVSGMSFEDYVEASILKPVGMKSSTLLYKNADPAKMAAGHTERKGVVVPVAHYPYNRALSQLEFAFQRRGHGPLDKGQRQPW